LKALGAEELYTEASVMARPFFESHGFEVTGEHQSTVRGAMLLRYAMRKKLFGETQ
jgi:putative acetyltransferase